MKYIDKISLWVALVTFIFSWSLFFYDSYDLWMSFGVALMATFCVWVSYVLVRLVYLAIKG